jgi:hypothetical protein
MDLPDPKAVAICSANQQRSSLCFASEKSDASNQGVYEEGSFGHNDERKWQLAARVAGNSERFPRIATELSREYMGGACS